jgi:chromosome segregation ATPase
VWDGLKRRSLQDSTQIIAQRQRHLDAEALRLQEASAKYQRLSHELTEAKQVKDAADAELSRLQAEIKRCAARIQNQSQFSAPCGRN